MNEGYIYDQMQPRWDPLYCSLCGAKLEQRILNDGNIRYDQHTGEQMLAKAQVIRERNCPNYAPTPDRWEHERWLQRHADDSAWVMR